jgi:glycine/D-amino acid oxidase-like deaminating enzyme
MVAETESELEILFDKQKIEAQAGLETHVLVGKELRDFAPYLAEDLVGATYCPSEGHANPFVSGPYFALRAKECGASIRVHANVSDIQVLDGDAKYRFAVSTSRGSVKARRIVNAAGAWSKEIANLLGLDLPIYAGGLHVNVTEPREHVLVPLVQHIGRRLTLKQTYDGTFIIGGGWPARKELSPKRYSNYWASAAGNTEVAVRVLPLLNDVRLLRTWTGLNIFMNDLTPIVGESARIPGYHVCLASTGFTLGPMLAVMLAEAMTSGEMNSLPTQYSPDR